MKTLLCHLTTFKRIEPALKPLADTLLPVCMDDAGGMSAPWGGETAPSGGFDVVFANTDAFFSPAIREFAVMVLKAPRIGWVQSSAAGIEHPMLQAIGAKAAAYTSGHEQSAAIAEWVLWAALDHFQRGPERRAQQASETWARLGFREIAGSEWVVVGYGTIGVETGRRLSALGARVTGVRRRPGPAEGAAEIVPPDRLAEVLPRADGVVLCAPLTEQTRHMMDASAFAAMKTDAVLINVGRGGLVDEAALVAALDAGEIGHAALDVVETEPLPAGHVLWQHPKVTLTPHIAAATEGSRLRTDALFLDNLSRFLNGRPLRNLADRADFEADQ